MKLWLDDVRPPWKYGYIGWEWAKNYDEAIDLLKTGQVTKASLDHDLCFEDQMATEGYKEKTGYDVICWMEENNIWPSYVECHSANPVGHERIQQVINRHLYDEGTRMVDEKENKCATRT